MDKTERRMRALARKVAVLSERKNRTEEARKVAAGELLDMIGDREIAVTVRGMVFTVKAMEQWAFPLVANREADKIRKHYIVAKNSGEAV